MKTLRSIYIRDPQLFLSVPKSHLLGDTHRGGSIRKKALELLTPNVPTVLLDPSLLFAASGAGAFAPLSGAEPLSEVFLVDDWTFRHQDRGTRLIRGQSSIDLKNTITISQFAEVGWGHGRGHS